MDQIISIILNKLAKKDIERPPSRERNANLIED